MTCDILVQSFMNVALLNDYIYFHKFLLRNVGGVSKKILCNNTDTGNLDYKYTYPL